MGRKREVIYARETDMIARKVKKRKKKDQEHPTHIIAQHYGPFDITGHYLVITGLNNAVGHICCHGNIAAEEGQLSQMGPRAK